jgi:hypothetical protein
MPPPNAYTLSRTSAADSTDRLEAAGWIAVKIAMYRKTSAQLLRMSVLIPFLAALLISR